MTPNETQIGGTHYTDMAVQPWDAMRAWMSPEQFCGYLLGTAIAYLARVNVTAPGKGGIDDIEKARHVLAKLAETWNFRIFNEFPKEVMSVVGETASSKRPVAPPAVSESAAGDHRPATDRPSVLGSAVMASLKDNVSQATIFATDDGAVAVWPGPDWSQAYDHHNFYCISCKGEGWFSEHRPVEQGCCWRWPYGQQMRVSTFNYPGHWRDSLRERPKTPKCEHKVTTNNLVGALTNTGWHCRDCGMHADDIRQQQQGK